MHLPCDYEAVRREARSTSFYESEHSLQHTFAL